MKGRTIIELTDVNTGEVEVHTDDNMVTNALYHRFIERIGREECCAGYLSDTYDNVPIWEYGLAGIVLFSDTNEENVDNMFFPSVKDNAIVGAAQKDYSYSGVCPLVGSYNTSESGEQEDGSIKFVYDFATNQANGLISSVSLTSLNILAHLPHTEEQMGTFFGNAVNRSGVGPMSRRNLIYRTNNSEGIKLVSQSMMFGDYNENVIFEVCTNPLLYTSDEFLTKKGTISVRAWEVPFTEIDLRAPLYTSSTGTSYINPMFKKKKEYEINLPEDYLTWAISKFKTTLNYIGYTTPNGVYYLFAYPSSSNTIVADEEFYLLKFEYDKENDNFDVSSIKIKNNTSKKIFIYGEGTVFFITDDESAVILCSDRVSESINGSTRYFHHLIRIDLTDNTKYLVRRPSDTCFLQSKYLDSSESSYYSAIYRSIGKVGNDFVCSSIVSDEGNSAYDFIINDETLEVNIISGTRTVGSGNSGYKDGLRERIFPLLNTKYSSLIFYYYGSSFSTYNIGVLKPDNYLATINNLVEPVTKTSSKTMKVTYIISFDD